MGHIAAKTLPSISARDPTVRRLLPLFVMLCALGAVAMAPASTDGSVTSSTVVGEERCDGTDLVAAEHDACSWTMTTTTAEAQPPVLEVRVTTAEPGDEVADGALVVWSSGDCAFYLDHDSGIGIDDVAPSGTALLVGCGDSTTSCIGAAGNTVQCETTYEDESHVDLDRGVRDGRDLVWTLTFEDELAEWAGLHDPGSVLVAGTASVGPRVPGTYTLSAGTCGTDTPCFDFGGDFIYGTSEHTVA